MKYLGGKHRHGKRIMATMLAFRPGTTRFVDLFCGGLSMTACSPHVVRVANDINPALITLYRRWQSGWRPSTAIVCRDEYRRLKERGDPEDPMTALVAIGCSWGGKWWGGYASDSREFNYLGAAMRGLGKKISTSPIDFRCGSYADIELRPGDLVYCDPPYRGTTTYKGVPSFDHDSFQDWCQTQGGLFVSEYELGMGDEVWRSPPDRKGMRKGAVDRLFYVAQKRS